MQTKAADNTLKYFARPQIINFKPQVFSIIIVGSYR